MITFLAIIGGLCILQFMARFIAVWFINILNKKERHEKKEIEDRNPIYWLSCDRGLNTRQEFGEIYFLPSLSVNTSDKAFEITVRWFSLSYMIAYYYKHANDY